MKDEKPQEPVKAADSQQEPAIPEDVLWPVGAEKPTRAIPKKAAAKKVPADDDEEPAGKKAAAKPDEAEKRPAAKADVETRKKKS